MLEYSLVYTDGTVIVSNEGIRLGSTYGKVLSTVPGNMDVITLGIGVGAYLGSLYVLFDGSNDVNI